MFFQNLLAKNEHSRRCLLFNIIKITQNEKIGILEEFLLFLLLYYIDGDKAFAVTFS